jgi:hypothetical protein
MVFFAFLYSSRLGRVVYIREPLCFCLASFHPQMRVERPLYIGPDSGPRCSQLTVIVETVIS